tara:strand:- start:1116 stop:1265 length:150 start_codon:yes stop_codon:yes gene_type:complete
VETVFLVLAIVFALVMLVAMFKYANFIHHFPHPEKTEEDKNQETISDDK